MRRWAIFICCAAAYTAIDVGRLWWRLPSADAWNAVWTTRTATPGQHVYRQRDAHGLWRYADIPPAPLARPPAPVEHATPRFDISDDPSAALARALTELTAQARQRPQYIDDAVRSAL